MATQLLLYEAAVPVSATRHADASVEPRDYSFAKGINAVPLTAVEFGAAAGEYAIVFAGTSEATMPAAILGVRAAQNLFVDGAGAWNARYVPAFVRRYPFVFSSSDDGKAFTVCVDESFAGFNREGRGERLFTDERKPSPYTERVLAFLQQYQVEFQRTQAFCRKLHELNVLEPMQAQISTQAGERMALGGFMTVNRARLKTLSTERLGELAKSDELELIYNHLYSMRNFAGMRERIASAAKIAEPEAATETQPVPAASSEDDQSAKRVQKDEAARKK